MSGMSRGARPSALARSNSSFIARRCPAPCSPRATSAGNRPGLLKYDGCPGIGMMGGGLPGWPLGSTASPVHLAANLRRAVGDGSERPVGVEVQVAGLDGASIDVAVLELVVGLAATVRGRHAVEGVDR